MNEEKTWLEDNWLDIVKNVGIPTAIFLSLKKYFMATARFFYYKLPWMRDIIELRQQNKMVLSALEEIKAQFKPNGGNSMMDRMNTITGSINRIDSRLLKLSARSRRIEDSMNIATFETDAHGMCMDANDSYLNLVGREISEILGSGWVSVIAYEDRDKVKKEWLSAIFDRRNFEMDYHMQHSDGTVFSVRGTATPIQTNGEVLGWVGSVKKIETHEEYIKN